MREIESNLPSLMLDGQAWSSETTSSKTQGSSKLQKDQWNCFPTHLFAHCGFAVCFLTFLLSIQFLNFRIDWVLSSFYFHLSHHKMLSSFVGLAFKWFMVKLAFKRCFFWCPIWLKLWVFCSVLCSALFSPWNKFIFIAVLQRSANIFSTTKHLIFMILSHRGRGGKFWHRVYFVSVKCKWASNMQRALLAKVWLITNHDKACENFFVLFFNRLSVINLVSFHFLPRCFEDLIRLHQRKLPNWLNFN